MSAPSEDFSKVDGVMEAIGGAQQTMFTGITSAFASVTPAQLGMFATALGPLGVANYIPAFFEATFNNVTSGMSTAVNHALLGVSTVTAQAGYTAVDSAV